jgi:hypothetical protein
VNRRAGHQVGGKGENVASLKDRFEHRRLPQKCS